MRHTSGTRRNRRQLPLTREEPSTTLESMQKNQHTPTSPAALDAGLDLGRMVEQRSALEEQIASQVARCRDLDLSWGHIGIMLGVSAQAAQQRYGRQS